MRGSLSPDLLSHVGWWDTQLGQQAVFSVVIHSRAAAGLRRLGAPLEEMALRMVARHDGGPGHTDGGPR